MVVGPLALKVINPAGLEQDDLGQVGNLPAQLSDLHAGQLVNVGGHCQAAASSSAYLRMALRVRLA